MVSVKNVLLISVLAGTAVSAQAAALQGEGSSATADIVFAQKTGTTSSIASTVALRSGDSFPDGTRLATGSIKSQSNDAQQFEVDWSGVGSIAQASYEGRKLVVAQISGTGNPDNKMYAAIDSDEADASQAVNAEGVLINSIPSRSVNYRVIALSSGGDAQKIPADTYKIQTISYIWSE